MCDNYEIQKILKQRDKKKEYNKNYYKNVTKPKIEKTKNILSDIEDINMYKETIKRLTNDKLNLIEKNLELKENINKLNITILNLKNTIQKIA